MQVDAHLSLLDVRVCDTEREREPLTVPND